jgi:hypothetical protein
MQYMGCIQLGSDVNLEVCVRNWNHKCQEQFTRVVCVYASSGYKRQKVCRMENIPYILTISGGHAQLMELVRIPLKARILVAFL